MLKLPPLLGLIMAGGFSSRLGRDKSLICWHGKPQWAHLSDIMFSLQLPYLLSGRESQRNAFSGEIAMIPDAFDAIGPIGGLLSAMRARPGYAFLVAACDMPMLDEASLQLLLTERQPQKLVTAFAAPDTPDCAEHLAAIWEPAAALFLEKAVAAGDFALHRALPGPASYHLVGAPDARVLMNVNSPEDFENVNKLLNKK